MAPKQKDPIIMVVTAVLRKKVKRRRQKEKTLTRKEKPENER